MTPGRHVVNHDELIEHTDRCSQFAQAKLLAERLLRELFHSLKTELIYQRKFETREDARQAIFIWIETWYNAERIDRSSK